ncbi:CoA pyrophosphatase [Rivibacter subsaxonicus]|uniref:8-oxo-dGTP pyrophosphatase MutT (NUDIX family) n=1 Tax=Rivibacter subsaxonicus TaxID=457575 RepID=A0A4Q7VHD4_9BURK|nr:CoA pyrophosphatase [Rivibacter subsaxonicus]RZT95328.1 8-oxo-dGTP pyrophosphatase MutT (NUDIX family) [Rivibacter subsaxonicus]
MQRVPIIDPRVVPVVGRDSANPAVPGARLTPEALRARFGAPPAWTPEIRGDGRLLDRDPTAASVLVPLVARGDGVSVLLTLRTDHLKDHAGQISFPGGRAEDEDVDVVATALRETEEEVGLARDHIEVIGALPIYTTVTNFVVTPVVAIVESGFSLRPDPVEVAEVFEVPLAFLMTPAHHQRHAFDWQGGRREFWSMPWHAPDRDEPYFIWGATAAMLRNLYRFLSV